MLKLPETVRYSMEPYVFNALLGNLRVEQHGKYTAVRGTYLEGTSHAYLMGYTSTRDLTGENVVIYGVQQDELDHGHIRKIAS